MADNNHTLCRIVGWQQCFEAMHRRHLQGDGIISLSFHREVDVISSS
jgi:hypothetical protein